MQASSCPQVFLPTVCRNQNQDSRFIPQLVASLVRARNRWGKEVYGRTYKRTRELMPFSIVDCRVLLYATKAHSTRVYKNTKSLSTRAQPRTNLHSIDRVLRARQRAFSLSFLVKLNSAHLFSCCRLLVTPFINILICCNN